MEDPEEPQPSTSRTSIIKTRKGKLNPTEVKPVPEKKMKKPRKNKKPVKNKLAGYESSDIDEENLKVDFNVLSIHTLRKYRKFYSMPIASNLNKFELTKQVNKHFPNIPLEDDRTIIDYFLHFAKNDGEVKDLKEE